MREQTIAPPAVAPKPDYWESRQHLMYYRYVDLLVRAFAADARSMIDVGSKNTPLLEAFEWVPRRDALDLREPYRSDSVGGIKANFLAFEPVRRYDFALCLQVLEHIDDVTRFARHLFEVADSVLVSVPFMWPENSSPGHVNDPVSLDKLVAWVGREPDYDVVVTEPLSKSRLIAYFHPPDLPFSRRAARGRIDRYLRGGNGRDRPRSL